MRNAPYLVQRLHREKTEGKLSDKIFSEVFSLDYMGSAEFEFGAFPKFLRSMHEALQADQLDTGCIVVNDRKVFFVFDEKNYSLAEAVEAIRGVATDKFRLKEFANFPPDHGDDSWCRADAWADIQHNLFWSYENLSVSLAHLINNSYAYMEARKAKG